MSSDFLLRVQINLCECSILFQKSPVSLVRGQHSAQVFSDALVLFICFLLFQLNFWKEKLLTWCVHSATPFNWILRRHCGSHLAVPFLAVPGAGVQSVFGCNYFIRRCHKYTDIYVLGAFF